MSLSSVFFNSYVYSVYVSTASTSWAAYINAASGASIDILYALDIDNDSNVYVGGSNSLAANVYGASGSLSSLTFPANSGYIVKYNLDGTPLWDSYVYTITGTSITFGIACQGSGNVYVAGNAGGGISNAAAFHSNGVSSGLLFPAGSAFLVQYDSDTGNVKWRSYILSSSSANPAQILSAKVDKNDNSVYVSGRSISATTLGIYHSNAQLAGTITPSPVGFIVKYTPTGVVSWWGFVDGGTGNMWGYDVAVDAKSNVYLVGTNGTSGTGVIYHQSGTNTGSSFPASSGYIVKYNSTGTYLWRAYINGTNNFGVNVDSGYNVYAVGGAGSIANVLSSSDVIAPGCQLIPGSGFLVKYTESGNVAWRLYIANNNVAADPSDVRGIVLDAGSNVYICGKHSNDPSPGFIYNSNLYNDNRVNIFSPPGAGFIYKYDSTGKWLSRFIVNSQNGASDEVSFRIAIDPNDNYSTYIAGTNPVAAFIYNSNDIMSNIALPTYSGFLIKCNSNGIQDTTTTTFKRWPPKDILFNQWSADGSNYSNAVTGTSYGEGLYLTYSNVTPVISGYDNRRVWDNSNTWSWPEGLFGSTAPVYVGVKFPQRVPVRLYSYQPAFANSSWTSWLLQGSNDGIDWTTVDVVSTSSAAMDNTKGSGYWEYIQHKIPCNNYRLMFTAPVTGNLFVRNLRMYSYETDEAYSPTFTRILQVNTSNGSGYRSATVTPNSNLYVGGYYRASTNSNIRTGTDSLIFELPNTENSDEAILTKFSSNTGRYSHSIVLSSNIGSILNRVDSDKNSNIYFGGYYVQNNGNTIVQYITSNGLVSNATLLPSTRSSTISAGYALKFNSQDQFEYGFLVDSTSSTDLSGGLTCDEYSNLYICGYYQAASTNIIARNASNVSSTIAQLPAPRGGATGFASKFTSSGQYRYSLIVDSTGNDTSLCIECDYNSNVYMGGRYGGQPNVFYVSSSNVVSPVGQLPSSTNTDGFVCKFNSEGQYEYSFTLSGGGTAATDSITGIACDPEGNVYMTGYYSGGGVIRFVNRSNVSSDVATVPTPFGGGGTAAVTSKFNSSGQFLYSFIIDAAASSFDYMNSVACDSGGNVYISGTYTGTPAIYYRDRSNVSTYFKNAIAAGGRGTYILKFSKDGQTLLNERYLDATNSDSIDNVYCDSNDNVYFSGSYAGINARFRDGTSTDIYTLPNSTGSSTGILVKMNENGSYVNDETLYGNFSQLSQLALNNMRCAFSLRRVYGTGPVVKVRRSSDNSTNDFYDSDGMLADVSSVRLDTWLAGSTGFVDTWYDQSGNSKDATQSNTSLQPTVDAYNRRINFSSTQYLTMTGGTIPLNSTYTVSAQHGLINNTNGGICGGGTNATNNRSNNFRRNTASYQNYWWNNDFNTGTYAQNNVVTWVFGNEGTAGSLTSGVTRLYQNRINVGSNTRSGWNGLATSTDFIGRTTNSEYLNGQLFWLTIFSAALSPVDRLIVETQAGFI